MFRIEYPFKKEILACGAQQQASFCLTKKNCGYVINDLGDLSEGSSWERYQDEIKRTKKELKVTPKVITHDLNPEYNSTKYAQQISQKTKGVKCFPVQHQQAHLASCIGENKVTGKIIGVVFDGSGYGEDGNFWGGDFFAGDLQDLKRRGHLNYAPIPKNGSLVSTTADEAVVGFLHQAFGDNFVELPIDFIKQKESSTWQASIERLRQPAYDCSAARLFDAVCVLVGARDRIDFLGQGVTELERIINRSSHVGNRTYDFTIKQGKEALLVNHDAIFLNIVDDLKKNISKSIISAVFHNTIIEIIRQVCLKIRQKEKIEDIILTGSVFQNKTLTNRLKPVLSVDGFNIIEHRHFICNDSNISFGQAVLANARG